MQGYDYWDLDGDGYAEMAALDRNLDGVYDVTMNDTNLDGYFEGYSWDSNFDGRLDASAVDTTGDGFLDTAGFDVDGDGVIDVLVDPAAFPVGSALPSASPSLATPLVGGGYGSFHIDTSNLHVSNPGLIGPPTRSDTIVNHLTSVLPLADPFSAISILGILESQNNLGRIWTLTPSPYSPLSRFW
jgi:hypothetical protein